MDHRILHNHADTERLIEMQSDTYQPSRLIPR